jgi:8-oxo-dGTP pyrophosphatase MutT (NUDIX family)
MPSYTTTGVLEAIRVHCPKPVLSAELRPAAVIVPIQDIGGEHYLTLIERAAGLSSHAGQVAFPGGNIADGDQDASDAALRELEEEIGISREAVEIIGELTKSSSHPDTWSRHLLACWRRP